MDNWYRLDNAAKLFAAVAKESNTSTYRVSLIFHESIDPALLQQAVNVAIGRFPLLSAKIRKGVFWNYFEQSSDPLLVEQETNYPCYPMKNLWAGHLARVLYFGKKLSVEVFHALTDGAGAVEFLKAVAYQYLLLKGHEIDPEGKIMLPNEGSAKYETEDSFKSYYTPKRFQKHKQPKAYRIKGTTVEPYGNIVISGEIATEELKAASKAMGLTITQYLTAVLVFAIFQENLRYGLYHETITVAVPVNLRSFFPSRSLRNFFGVANICVPVSPETTFCGVAQAVKDEFSKKVTRAYLEERIRENVYLEKNRAIKLVPLFMKKLALSYGFTSFGENFKTLTVSNLGSVSLPSGMAPHVASGEAIIYPTRKSPQNCGVVSVGGVLTVSFTTTIIDRENIRGFFHFLAQQGMEVTVYSNEWGEEEKGGEAKSAEKSREKETGQKASSRRRKKQEKPGQNA